MSERLIEKREKDRVMSEREIKRERDIERDGERNRYRETYRKIEINKR